MAQVKFKITGGGTLTMLIVLTTNIFQMEKVYEFFEKAHLKMEELREKRIEILSTLENRDALSFEEVIKKGKELELLREKIRAIEEAIHG